MKIKKSLTRILVIAEKEWIQILRDSRSLILSLAAPALLIMLFGYALSVDVKNVSIALFDQDRSSMSRQFAERFRHTEYLSVNYYPDNYRDIDRLVNSEKISLALVIPRRFEKNIRGGKPVDLQLIADGSDSTSSTVAIGYVKMIIADFNSETAKKLLNRAGISEAKLPINFQTRVWYNPELQSKNFLIPGLIVLVLAIISSLIASLTISREWERGTMESLITSPVRRFEIVIGKLIPYLFIGVFDIVAAVLAGYFIFDVPLKGSFTELYLLALLFLAGTSSLGIFISSATRSQVLSVQVAMVATYLPSFILSGFIFPVENMPFAVKIITYLIPAKYLIVLIKGIELKGVAASILWTQIVFLAIFCAVVMTLSIKKLKLKLPE